MKPIEITRLFSRRGYIRTVGSALALLTVIMGIGFSAWTATINRPKEPWETRRILTGIVSDSICGKGHTINGHGDRECTRLCVKLGANYALVFGKSLFILKGHDAELDKFAGQAVMVVGAVNRDTVRVESIAPLDLLHSAVSFEVSKANLRVE
jgi:hypothetical protein